MDLSREVTMLQFFSHVGIEPTILVLRSKDATNVLKVFGDFRDKKLGFSSENPYPGLEETSREYGHAINFYHPV